MSKGTKLSDIVRKYPKPEPKTRGAISYAAFIAAQTVAPRKGARTWNK